MRTLVVEDDYISSEVMSEMMSAYGDVDVAEDGLKALQYVNNALENNEHYDLILLDVMMPEMNGQDALENIRKIESTFKITGLDCSKVVMTTALDDFDNIRRAFKNQCDGYLIKPIDRAKLERLLLDFKLL